MANSLAGSVASSLQSSIPSSIFTSSAHSVANSLSSLQNSLLTSPSSVVSSLQNSLLATSQAVNFSTLERERGEGRFGASSTNGREEGGSKREREMSKGEGEERNTFPCAQCPVSIYYVFLFSVL